jgi:putative endonuclease
MTTSRQRMATGGYGEARAARHLVEQGMVVLDRNWRCELGEIDLVLREGPVLVFCEVKTRASAAFGGPLESVTATKVARLRRLGARWMHEHGVHADEVRLDLVGVLLDRGGEPRLQHVRGVG